MKKISVSICAALLLLLSLLCLASCGKKECPHEWSEPSTITAATCESAGRQVSQCQKCDMLNIEEIAALGHNLDFDHIEWSWNGYASASATLTCLTDASHTKTVNATVTNAVTKTATCTEKGVRSHTAKIEIGESTHTNTKNESIPLHGHTQVILEALSSTCTATGLTEGKLCSACNEILIPQQITPKAAHTEESIAAVAATCTATGLSEGKKCSVCREVLLAQQVTPMAAHTEAPIAAVAATCTAMGLSEGKKCSVCQEVLLAQQVTPMAAHTEAPIAAVAATCTTTGLSEGKKCSVCQEVLLAQQTTPKVAHTEAPIAPVLATCTSNGWTEGKKCSVCQSVILAQLPIEKLPHTEETLPSRVTSCSAEGLTEGKKCSVCHEVLAEQQPIEKLPHTEETVAAVSATCTATGLTEGKSCSVCHEVIVAQELVEKAAHTEVFLLAVTPTCTETGLTQGKKCLICDEVLVAQEIVPLANHTEQTIVGTPATCLATGLSDGIICSVCKQTITPQTILSITACNYVSTVTAPTCTSQGYTTHTCSVCTDTYTDAYVTKLVHRYSGAWQIDGEHTVRECQNECGTTQRILALSATYSGIRLLTGDSVWKNDVTVTAMLSDGTTAEVRDFTLENDVMTVDGSNSVTVQFHTMSTTVSVPAIYDNLPWATSFVDFIYDADAALKNDAVTITGYTGTATNVVIPSYIPIEEVLVPVRCLGTSAFANCTELISVTIPGNIKTIETYCFKGCKRLETVTFNEGLQAIYGGAFAGCSITSVTLPDSVVTLSSVQGSYVNNDPYSRYNYIGAFEGCAQLKTVTIGNGLEAIPLETFRDCSALAKVVIGDRVTTIGELAFEGCTALTDITIGKSVETLESYTFANCSTLTSLTIGESVKSLGSYAFMNCSELTSINIPGNVKTIDIYCFKGCKRLESVTFNEGLQTIHGGAFAGCPITSVTLPDSVVTLSSVQGSYVNNDPYNRYNYIGAFEGCAQLKTVTIGNGLEAIPLETFRDCSALAKVVIGDRVTTIGELAFEGCTALTDVTLGERVETIGAYAFANCTSLEFLDYSHVKTISDHAFDGCIYLKRIDLGTGVNSVGSYAFAGCTDLTSVTIPDNVITLGSNVFNNCTNIQDVTIVDGRELVRSFGSNVFNGCTNLDRLYYTGTADDWAKITINANNSYPLNVTPYYYSEEPPTSVGDYWYYNAEGEKRVWNVSETAFEAEYASENFVEIFGDEDSSYATLFFNEIDNDSSFKSGLRAWEALHIIADTSFSEGVWKVSKKDLYKLVLFDLLCGEANAKETVLDAFDTSAIAYMDDLAKDIFGSEVTHDFLKNSPIKLEYSTKVAKYSITGIQYIFEKHSNMYDALLSCATYLVLSDMDASFQALLTQIANDSSNPRELRDAAREYAEIFEMSAAHILANYALEYYTANVRAAFTIFADHLWDKTVEMVFPELLVAQSLAKGVLLLADIGFNVDGIYMAYYKLNVAVHTEAALRKIIHNTLPDYYRVSNRTNSENYVYAINMYRTSVLLGFDYSNDLLSEDAVNRSDEEKEEYIAMMNSISSMKVTKQDLYNRYDDIVAQSYALYYA